MRSQVETFDWRFQDSVRGAFPSMDQSALDYFDTCRSRTFLSFFYIKTNSVTFIKRFETSCFDTGKMNEHIWAAFLLNEAISFLIIKPLDSSFSQNSNLLM